MQQYKLTLRSDNAKTGPIPVSITSADSCPPSCPLRDRGCYAKNGPISWQWKKATGQWSAFLQALQAIPAGTPFRHNQAGDLPGKGERIDGRKLRSLTRAAKHLKGWTYTHCSPSFGDNAQAIAEANQGGFTVNLSADTAAEADELADLGIAPVVVVLPTDAPATGNTTPAGRKVVVCPHETHGVQCKTCLLCQKRDRSVLVGFKAHGAQKRAASEIARG